MNESFGHVYDRHGKLWDKVPGAKPGTWVDPDVRHMRKFNLFPGVGGILKMVANPYALELYFQTQLLEAALTLPRNEGESLQDFSRRVVLDSKEHSRGAADSGKDRHGILARYLESGKHADDPLAVTARTVIDSLSKGHKELPPMGKLKSVSCERPVIGKDWAGTPDTFLVFERGTVLWDLKTQEIVGKQRADGRPKDFAFYEKWRDALSAYGSELDRSGHRCHLLSLVVDRNDESVYATRVWDAEERKIGWLRFLSCKRLWQTEKNHKPDRSKPSGPEIWAKEAVA